MKKLITLFTLMIFAISMSGQIINKQIAFGAKGIDSISGATTVYYYFNTTGTVAGHKLKASSPITAYEIAAVQAMMVHPLVYTASDSCHIWLELSLDNTNWVKWSNAGATTNATQTQYYNGSPKTIGSNVTYLYTPDLVSTTSTDAGAIFQPKGLVTPYFRVAIQRYKASSATYPVIWVTLKKLAF